MVHPTQQRPGTLRQRSEACLTVTVRGRARSLKLPSWLLGSALSVAALLVPAYIGATGYLIYRDDLLGGSLARQVSAQYAYEDRIAALRSEIDRLTSRHLVETQGVEDQVRILLERQASINERQAMLDKVLARAGKAGVATLATKAAPVPTPKPTAAATPAAASRWSPLAYAAEPHPADDDIITGSLLRRGDSVARRAAEREKLRPVLKDVQSSLDAAQGSQGRTMDTLMAASRREATRLVAALRPIGLRPAKQMASGGPLVAPQPLHFVEKAAMLEHMLDDIADIRRQAAALPLKAPLTAPTSSRFGNRVDPFLGKPAMHTGVDFVASTGTKVRVTAPGTVVSAGTSGGYGTMVEVRHAGGLSTRYGHLSRALVAEGAKVAAGDVIGLVGSTGRSTGPHLHYETRRKGAAVDPSPYLAAGRAL